MNEQTQHNRQRNDFLKNFVEKNPLVNPEKQFGEH